MFTYRNTQRKLFAFANMNTGLYTSAGLSCSEITLADPPAYSATSLASASILYNNWFTQSKPGQLFGLQGKFIQSVISVVAMHVCTRIHVC